METLKLLLALFLFVAVLSYGYDFLANGNAVSGVWAVLNIYLIDKLVDDKD